MWDGFILRMPYKSEFVNKSYKIVRNKEKLTIKNISCITKTKTYFSKSRVNAILVKTGIVDIWL